MLRRISRRSWCTGASPLLPPSNRPFSSPSPVTDVRSTHAFDEKRLVKYLKDSGAVSSISFVTVKQFSNGQSNPTFILTDDAGSKLVVRKQPPGKLLTGAHAVDREYKVMSALNGTVPVPKTRGYCADPSILGTPFYFYDFVDGRFFKDPALLQVSSREERTQIYQNMIDTLARIHAVDIDKCGLGDFGKHKSPAF